MNTTNSLGPQRRYIAIADAEVRYEDEGGGLRFSGHAAVFDRKTYIGPKPHGFWEKVRIGAFAKTITEGDVRMLHNHNPDLILARSTIKEGPGSLVLSEEKRGLLTKAEWAPTSYASDLAVNLRLGTVSQMSFSFIPVKEEWTRDEKSGADTRELTEVELYDVATVTFPAYADTDAAMRSIGLDGLLRVAELNEAQRADFYMTLRTGLITPEVAPVLQAASEALADLAQRGEPAETTPHEDGQSSDYRRLRFRAMAAMAASWKSN